ncbi:MAG: Ribosomal large subunit pseudouridine synthase A [Candidatus Omnitrophica bacterium ADurb.Bin277]|nr:MAG: Ribosomal large subunit pseudouridine synthase A [Candidatus Omnitrophica bacterium ADurb.Bin277]
MSRSLPLVKNHPRRDEKDLYVETGYKILYEDEAFLIADKPAPLPVHPVGCFRQRNLLSLLQNAVGANGSGLQIVNRLDSETSGLVIVSRSPEIAGRLGVLFEKREVLKEYNAVVFGIPEKPKGSVEVPLGLKSGGVHNIRVPDQAGQDARTDYEVLSVAGEYSLLRIIPRTGRTHQIRVHLAFLGHPVVGDKIYIDPSIFERYIHEGWREDMRSVVKSERLLLHACRLEFRHPVTKKKMIFTSTLPSCFDPFLK